MWGIREKLMAGFGGLLGVVVVLGLLTVARIDALGRAIDVILRENYRSVVACQDMKEALERVDSGLLYVLVGEEAEGARLIEENREHFRAALAVEMGNLTLPGEREAAALLGSTFARYEALVDSVLASTDPAWRQQAYFRRAQPLFVEAKDIAQSVLEQNQANMSAANDAARQRAGSARQILVLALLLLGAAVLCLGWLSRRWILEPIRRLDESTRSIAAGNLDLVLPPGRGDELGGLAASFNEMAAALRIVRREDRRTIDRTRRATEGVLGALPAAVAVLNSDGRIEMATDSAARHFGLRVGGRADEAGHDWLAPLLQRSLASGGPVARAAEEGYVQRFIDGRERFFQPHVAPIPVGPGSSETNGLAVILRDVTDAQARLEIGRDRGLVVSHQLKTPLTSLRMSLHLLLDPSTGSLNAGQTDLLLAARDDSERLVAIINDLIELDRQGRGAGGAARPVEPARLLGEAVERVRLECRDRGLRLVEEIAADLPAVQADPERVGHVLDNLLGNAIRFTSPGGAITVTAAAAGDAVAFSVSDTGAGIAPEEIERIFEPFHRGPGQEASSGVGLGLTIAREIVRAHGGELEVASRPGDGSTFTFRLPAAAAAGH